jgi:hypothetical protein
MPQALNTVTKNPYLVNTGGTFDWFGLKDKNPDVTDKILGLAGLRIELTWDNGRRLPDGLRPPGMPEERECHLLTRQTFVIERSRRSIRGHGPRDSLTVTFSELVDRNCYTFQYAEEQGWPFDTEAVFAAMDHTQTWTEVKKIRLISKRVGAGEYGTSYHMQLVRRGAHGQEIVTIPQFQLSFTQHLKEHMAQRLTQGLQLRHAVVGGVHEYTVM